MATTCVIQDARLSPSRPRRKHRSTRGQREPAGGRFCASQRRGYDPLVLLGVDTTRRINDLFDARNCVGQGASVGEGQSSELYRNWEKKKEGGEDSYISWRDVAFEAGMLQASRGALSAHR